MYKLVTEYHYQISFTILLDASNPSLTNVTSVGRAVKNTKHYRTFH